MSYLDIYLAGRKPITEFREMTDKEWDDTINKIIGAQRKAEEERITNEQKAKDDYQKRITEERHTALKKHYEYLEYCKTVHGCGCIIKNGEERQPGICLDCYGQEFD